MQSGLVAYLIRLFLLTLTVLADGVVQVKECARLALEAVDGGMCVVIGLQR